jgi:hypothetical protein
MRINFGNHTKDMLLRESRMLPDDIRKSARVKDWIRLNPELTRQTEKEIDQYRNGSSAHE